MTRWKTAFQTYTVMAMGAFILAFGLYNIHVQSGVTEGGVLGATLLLRHFFGLSPSISEVILDCLCYLLAYRVLGRGFVKNAVLSTLLYSAFYALLEHFPPLIHDLTALPWLAAGLGALFVGVGVGLVISAGGACCGDDALALTISHLTGWDVGRSYLVTDITVLTLSLTYIPAGHLLWSLLSVTLSSGIISLIQKRPQEASA